MKKIITTIAIFTSLGLYAQNNVGIGTSTPSSQAILEIKSDDKGILISRLTTVSRNALGTSLTVAEDGMLVYDKDLTAFYYWDGPNLQWVQVGGGSNTDSQTLDLTGNTLSISGGNSITITDNVDDADNDPTNEIELPASAVTGQVLSWDGASWIAQNSASGADNWGNQTVVTSGSNISGNGTAGNPILVTDNVDDADNIVGNEYNTSVSLSGTTLSVIDGGGAQTVNLNSIKDYNWYEVGATRGADNINDDIFTQGNVGIGISAPTGVLNLKGLDAGSNSYGDGASLVIGDVLGSHLELDNNEIVAMNGGVDDGNLYIIGKQFSVNTYPIGGPSSIRRMTIKDNGNVAIGAHNATEKLHIQGSVRIEDGTQGAGKVLTSDANGKASWKTPSTSLLLGVSYPSGTSVPTNTFPATGTHVLANFTAPSDGLYMICAVVTVNIDGGQFGDYSAFQSNAQTYVVLSGGGSSAAEEHLSEDVTKQISISYLFNLASGDVVNFKVGQQQATSFGFSGLEMRVVKF